MKRLTEKLLNSIKVEKEKKKKNEAQKPAMSPFQEAIHERLQIASKKIASVMELDENFDEELKDIETELQKSA